MRVDAMGCLKHLLFARYADTPGKSEKITQFPRLSSQHRDYIIKELKDFRDGKRANDPAGMMGDIAKKLSDKEIQAVAEYLAAQPR